VHALLETSEQEARLTWVQGPTSKRFVFPWSDWLILTGVVCATESGFWGVGQRPSDNAIVSFRTVGGRVAISPLEQGMQSVTRIGPYPLVVYSRNGVFSARLASQDGSLTPNTPLARVPFVSPIGAVTDDGASITTEALMGTGATAELRVRIPAEVAP
jgi:hypothetical protein